MILKQLPALGIVFLAFNAWAQPTIDPPGSDSTEGVQLGARAEARSDGAAANSPPKTQAKANRKAASASPSEQDPKTAVSAGGAPVAPTPARPVVSDWFVTLYGFAALNAIHDSTQSFASGVNNNILARRGTYQSQHSQFSIDPRDSRLGLYVNAPEFEGMKADARGELDFAATPAPDATQLQRSTQGLVRMRHFYMTLKTPIVDLLAGQYHNLFGWGGAGYFPATLGYLGVPGQVFSRQGQVRLSKTLGGESVEFEIAAAATRPASSASGAPDLQAGLRLALPSWTGAQTQGYGQPSLGALGVGASVVGRRFKVAEFVPAPADSVEALGGGFVVNAFVPVIPAESIEERGNALSLTGEFSFGTGISDMYTQLTGGALFPTLPNPTGEPFPTTPYYVPDIDSGIVTFDENFKLRTIDWQGFVVGAQYYLPIDSGRVWIAGIYSRLQSNNIVHLTPPPNRGLVFEKAEYIDGTVFFALTNSLQVGASYQTVTQTFGDGATATNHRTMGALHLFF